MMLENNDGESHDVLLKWAGFIFLDVFISLALYWGVAFYQLKGSLEKTLAESAALKARLESRLSELVEARAERSDLERALARLKTEGGVAGERGLNVFAVLKDTSFKKGDWHLLPGGESDLLRTAVRLERELEKSPSKFVLVTASTCNIPYRSSSNWHLSGERGAEVAYTLSTKGKIPPGRILVMALGQYHPLVPNNSEARRALNRRVDIRIIDGTAARDLLPAARR